MKKHLLVGSLLLAFGSVTTNISAQGFMGANPAKNWQNKSIEKDSVYGTGSDAALEFLKEKGRKSIPVIVCVEDGGVYFKHPALNPVVWTNTREVAGNKMDDDKNGYVDDVHGWDFIGGKDSDVNKEALEMTRMYRDLGKKFNNVDAGKVAPADTAQYHVYLRVKTAYEKKLKTSLAQYNNLKGVFDTIALVKKAMGVTDFNRALMDSIYHPTDSAFIRAKARLQRNFKRFSYFIPNASADSIMKLLGPGLAQLSAVVNYQLNLNWDPRYLVGDNYEDASQRYYGNNDVAGPAAEHGTHVSGIIAAVRSGKPDAQEGIADNVQIMVVRTVPDGDERDKDVANGIRYAVDNGARVINMSFGKGFTYNKKAVDEAVKYAEAHDVLLVHAAGNDHSNNDSVDNFPTRIYLGGKAEASNWIEVGASDVKGKPGSFSNYGKHSVDLFAPGVKIYSTIPDTAYAYFNGTSMASPCVAGVAAIIREYFPTLTAKQVKELLMESVTKPTFQVAMPGYDKMVTYSDLCISGGIVDAYAAVQLAIKKYGDIKVKRAKF